MVLKRNYLGRGQEKKAELENLLNLLADNKEQQAEINNLIEQRKELMRQIIKGRKEKPDDERVKLKYLYSFFL